MSRVIRRTRQVRADIIEIYLYIFERNPQSAERVLAAINQSILSLRATPGIGRRWDSLDPRLEGMRVVVVTPYSNYLIFFRPASDAIEIFRVVHGARKLDRIVDEIQIDFDEY